MLELRWLVFDRFIFISRNRVFRNENEENKKKLKKRKTHFQCRDINSNVVTLAPILSPMSLHLHFNVATSTFQCRNIVAIEEQCRNIAFIEKQHLDRH